MKRRVLVIGLFIMLAAVPVMGGESQLYTVQHRVAADLLPLVESVIGDRGSASLVARTNAILIVAPRKAIDEALEVLASQDRRLRTIVVLHRVAAAREIEESGIQLRWSASHRGLRIGNVESPDAADGAAFSSYLDWREKILERASSLRVVEGSRSNLRIGRQFPLAEATGSGAAEWVETGSGFIAEARILGDGRVRLVTNPTQLQGQPDGRFLKNAARTTLILDPGVVQVIAEVAQDSTESAAQAGRNVQQAIRAEEHVLLVSVEIE